MKRRGWICLVLLIALGACSQRRVDQLVLISPESTETDLAALLQQAADPVAVLEALRQQQGLPLSFWAETVPDDMKDLVREHPCGDTLTALVKRVPAFGEYSYLVPERVVEIDVEGREIRQWQMPIDSVVVAIHGDAILLRMPVGSGEGALVLGLSIQTSGDFRVVPKQNGTAARVPCPPLPAFGDSDYLRCWRFSDLATGRRRFLAYQRPCT